MHTVTAVAAYIKHSKVSSNEVRACVSQKLRGYTKAQDRIIR